MLWRINFTIDNGYYEEELVCVVVASNEQEAHEVFTTWVVKLLKNDDYIKREKIKPIDCSNGIVYSDMINE